MNILILAGVAVFFGLVGRYVAASKGRSEGEGFFFGFFLSVVGIIIVALLPNKEKKPEVKLSKEEAERIRKNTALRVEKNKKQDRIFLIVLAVLVILFIISRLTGDV